VTAYPTWRRCARRRDPAVRQPGDVPVRLQLFNGNEPSADSCVPPLSAYRILSPSIDLNCGSIDVVNGVLIETPLCSVADALNRSVGRNRASTFQAPPIVVYSRPSKSLVDPREVLL
jgi:hypothetical protein